MSWNKRLYDLMYHREPLKVDYYDWPSNEIAEDDAFSEFMWLQEVYFVDYWDYPKSMPELYTLRLLTLLHLLGIKPAAKIIEDNW